MSSYLAASPATPALKGVHYDACPRAYVGHLSEAAHADCPVCDAIYAHRSAGQCDMILDTPMDGEECLWDNTCNITIYYLESDIPA